MISRLKTRKENCIYIMMTEQPGPTSQFVEVEDSSGRSVDIGRWVMIDDLFALEIEFGPR